MLCVCAHPRRPCVCVLCSPEKTVRLPCLLPPRPPADHYTGLKEDWRLGYIYCSHVTARLIAHMLGVHQRWLQPMPLDTPITIQGVEVTLVDANHCPGAVQFLFRLADGRKFVHTGDAQAGC